MVFSMAVNLAESSMSSHWKLIAHIHKNCEVQWQNYIYPDDDIRHIVMTYGSTDLDTAE